MHYLQINHDIINKAILLFTLLAASIISCVESSDEEYDVLEIRPQTRSVMQDDTSCVLPGRYKKTTLEELVGTWTDTLVWKTQPNDTCWYGIEELDIHLELQISRYRTFVLTRRCTRPEYNTIDKGEVFLHNDSNRTELLLAINPLGEKRFKPHGDNIYRSIRNELRWTESNTIMLITEFERNGYRLRKSTEYEKRHANNG